MEKISDGNFIFQIRLKVTDFEHSRISLDFQGLGKIGNARNPVFWQYGGILLFFFE
jgi:hypothetical protein